MKQLVEFAKWSKEDQGRYVEEYIPEFDLMLGKAERTLSQVEELNRDYYRGRFAMKKQNRVVNNWEEVNGALND